jgi:hypothetical protein
MVRREAEVQRLWGSGAFRGQVLRAQSGERFEVLYEGRRGAGAGPDFRDAVLVDELGARRYGDVEIHLRAAGWRAHGHDRDHRYDAVALHVVLNAGMERETALAGGTSAALTVLEAAQLSEPPSATMSEWGARWPCHGLSGHRGSAALRTLLRELGVQRLNERAARFAEEVRREEQYCAREPTALWNADEHVLWAALAEGLGYGRDREALRAAGLWLIRDQERGGFDGHFGIMSSVERNRLAGLQHLLERWKVTGPWPPLGAAIAGGSPREASVQVTRELCIVGGAISPGRARIIVANVVLPFAVARARLLGDSTCASRALEVYGALAAPPSNTITRLLARQLGMSRLPTGAASHMGLQQVWTTSCRQKLCDSCRCACPST